MPPAAPRKLSPIAAADSFARDVVKHESAIDPSRFPVRSIAVAPLQVFTRDTSLQVLGFGLADLLMTDLSRSAQLVVVDRLRLDAVMREQQLAATGRVDAATAPRTGRLIGARTLVIGEVRDADGGQLALSTRLVNTTSASVAGGPSARGGLNGLLDAEKRVATDLFASLGITLTPREQTLLLEKPTGNIAALLAYSRGVRREANGDLRGARIEYQNALRLDRSFRQAGVRANQIAQSLGELPATDAIGRLVTLTDRTVDLVNRPSVPVTSDASDPAFTSARRLATLIISVVIP